VTPTRGFGGAAKWSRQPGGPDDKAIKKAVHCRTSEDDTGKEKAERNEGAKPPRSTVKAQ
jgi:hypothetical protein